MTISAANQYFEKKNQALSLGKGRYAVGEGWGRTMGGKLYPYAWIF